MRVLGSTVLAFEWLILALAVPVAINTAGVPARGAWVFLGFTTMLIIAAAALITRPVGVALGWAVQVSIVTAGLLVPLLALLGLLFAFLYFAAIRLSQRVEDVQARRTATPDGSPADTIGQTEPVGDSS